MANEFSFMFINIEDTLAQYKEGMIDKNAVVEEIQMALDQYQGELATITFDEPTSVFGRNGGSTGDVVESTFNITKV